MKEPGSYCLAPKDAVIPLALRVAAQVQDLFARNRLPLPVARVVARPGPRTLVNFPTRLQAGDTATHELTTTVLGITVHVTATPSTWAWTIDGQPVSASADRLAHTFLDPGPSRVSVVVTWTGTFRIAGESTEHPLTRPAVVPGTPLLVKVLQAHAERVTR